MGDQSAHPIVQGLGALYLICQLQRCMANRLLFPEPMENCSRQFGLKGEVFSTRLTPIT